MTQALRVRTEWLRVTSTNALENGSKTELVQLRCSPTRTIPDPSL